MITLVIISLAVGSATAIAISVAAIVVANRVTGILDDTAIIVSILIAAEQRRIRRLRKRQIEHNRRDYSPDRLPVPWPRRPQ